MHVKDKMTIFGVGEESPVLLGDAIIYFQASVSQSGEDCACVLSLFSHVQLFASPWAVCSPPGSAVYGILQARILEWVAMPSSRRSSQPRD